jgi:iron(III) transport system permease protein
MSSESLLKSLSRRSAGPLLRPGAGWRAATALICMIALMPPAAIAVIALSGGESVWPHLMSTVLPPAARQTALLIAGVVLVSLAVGAPLAWLVTTYRFPGRDILQWMLVLPLAVPTYIMAYTWVEAMDFTGPFQTALREAGGFTTRRDYLFPDMRTLAGAIFIMSAALYPYIYVTARAAFEAQAHSAAEVARTLGRSGWSIYWTVSLPLARPALAAGAAFIAMECLNDIGAMEFLGIRTITVSIYQTWLQRSSLAGAAQLALLLLGVVLLVLAAERLARGSRRFHVPARKAMPAAPRRLTGWRAWLATGVCLGVVIVCFGVPAYMLARASVIFAGLSIGPAYWAALQNTLVIAALAAAVTVSVALVVAAGLRFAPGPVAWSLARAATVGYTIPGAVIALGILVPLAAFDNALDAMLRANFGISTGLLLSGSLFALLFAYLVRFLAIAFGAIEGGYEKLSPNMDAAARTLGQNTLGVFRSIHLPLLRPALGAAALLVFVDSLKELPATLLLRPFNFDTLATKTYGLASLEQFNQSAPFALTIVLAGVVPVILLMRSMSFEGIVQHTPPVAENEQAKHV